MFVGSLEMKEATMNIFRHIPIDLVEKIDAGFFNDYHEIKEMYLSLKKSGAINEDINTFLVLRFACTQVKKYADFDGKMVFYGFNTPGCRVWWL